MRWSARRATARWKATWARCARSCVWRRCSRPRRGGRGLMLDEDHPLHRVLNRRVARRIGRRTERYTVLEAILIDMAESAMAGDRAAARDFLKFVRDEVEADAAERARAEQEEAAA